MQRPVNYDFLQHGFLSSGLFSTHDLGKVPAEAPTNAGEQQSPPAVISGHSRRQHNTTLVSQVYKSAKSPGKAARFQTCCSPAADRALLSLKSLMVAALSPDLVAAAPFCKTNAWQSCDC